MFYDCRLIEHLDLGSFDTSKVANMTAMFKKCQNLSSLDLCSFDTSQTREMSEIFAECPSLERIAFGAQSRNVLLDLSGDWYLDGNGPYSLEEILEKTIEEDTGGVIERFIENNVYSCQKVFL